MDLASTLYPVLSGDATLVGYLSSYQSTPAVFTQWPVPDNAARPYIVIRSITDVPDDGLADAFGRDLTADISVIGDQPAHKADVESAAERVRALLHRKQLAPAGYRGVFTRVVSGPTPAPTDNTLVGRVVTVRLIIEET